MLLIQVWTVLPAFLIFLPWSSISEARKINGEHVLELPIYRSKHLVQTLLEFADARGYTDVQNLNQTEFLQSVFKKLKVAAKPTNETIAIFKKYDSFFYTTIGIGTPARQFNLSVDTSWSDSWVVSINCTGWNCVDKNKYNSMTSKTAEPNGRPFYLDFGNGTFGGNLTGSLAIDTVKFGHVNATNVTFAEVTTIPWFMFFTRYDGILGMGKTPGVIEKYSLIWKELIKQNKFKNNVFSLYLNRDPTIPRAGSILIGAVDPHHYNGSAQEEVQLTGENYWKFSIKDIILSHEKKKSKRHQLLHFCADSCFAMLDSGSNSITGPATQIKQINKLLNAQPFFLGFNRVPCESIAKLPELYFMFGKKELVLYGEHYIQKIFYNGYALCLSTFVESDDQNNQDTWDFGVPLLAKYYTIFNFDRNTVKITDYKSK